MEYSTTYGYIAAIDLPPGGHEFKFSDDNWQKVNLGSVSQNLQLGQEVPVASGGGNFQLHLDDPHKVIFILSLTSPTQATLRLVLDDESEPTQAGQAQE